jgi:hypothetical protein
LRRVRIALIVGLLLMAIAIAVTLTRSPPVVAGSDSTPLAGPIAESLISSSLCQSGETLPHGTTALRLSLYTIFGPEIKVRVLSGDRELTSGARSAGWTEEGPTVRVGKVNRTVSDVKVCVQIGRPLGQIVLYGSPAGSANSVVSGSGQPVGGRMRIEYLESGSHSWWSSASSVAKRIGLGRWPSGTWIVLLIIALALAVLVAAVRLALEAIGGDAERAPVKDPSEPFSSGDSSGAREDKSAVHSARRVLARVPRVAKMCALVAFLNAVCWSLVTPPFQVVDEPNHLAYVQQLAETGSLPHKMSLETYSPEEGIALSDLHEHEIQFSPGMHTISTSAQQHALEKDLSRPLGRSGSGGAGTATANPPLYYALETIPYGLGSGGTLLERLTLMRLLSALMAGFTALFAFLFLRESLPRFPWAWAVGGLGVALAPLLGFVSGAVNPEAMLFAVSAALFYCLARAFRRGLTRRLAMTISLVMIVGFMTKLNFIGLAPGTVLGVVLLARREAKVSGSVVYRRVLAPALVIALSPVVLYALVNLVSGDPVLGIASHGIEALTGAGSSITRELSFTWQLYLPRLPGMHNYFQEVFTTRQIWFDGLVGLYGWLDTVFPGWVYDLALIPAAAIGALCLRELVIRRTSLRRRLSELVTYATISLGVLVLVGLSGYQNASVYPAEFAEPRYLLPMLVLWGAVLALAARGAGRRWGPVVGALIVVLLLSHNIFSQLQVIARFYG